MVIHELGCALNAMAREIDAPVISINQVRESNGKYLLVSA